MSVICRPLSNREPLNEFSSNFILEHWNGYQCVSKCSHFGYTLQQQCPFMWFSVRISLNIYRSENISKRRWVEDRNIQFVPSRCIEEWNTQFVSGTFYAQTLRRGMKLAVVSGILHAQTLRRGMKHAVVSGICPNAAERNETRSCVWYIICPNAAERNETRDLCPVHYMPRRCVEEWNTQFVSSTLYAQPLRRGMKHAICVRYIICTDVA